MNDIITLQNIKKNFTLGTQTVPVLKGINLTVPQNEFLVITGPSGCGKSTLLHTILGLEIPSEGTVHILNKDIYSGTSEDDRSDFRKTHIGMVYQQPNWIRSLNVLENVAFPLLLQGIAREECLKRAYEELRVIRMETFSQNKPSELSGGQQQRVALARALTPNPEILVADEPTGNLDFSSGQEIMELLVNLNKTKQKTVVMVTHDLEYLKYASNAIQMLDGAIVKTYGKSDIENFQKTIQTKRGVNSNEEINTSL